MSIFETSERSFFTANLKVIGAPLLFLCVLIVLSGIVINTGFKKVIEVRGKLKESQNQEVVLGEKLSVLQKGQESADILSDLSVVAIPEQNSAPMALTGIKGSAATNSILLSDVSATQVGAEDATTKSVKVTFSSQGQLSEVLTFLISLENSLPLTRVDEASLSEGEDKTSAKAEISVFYAPFPETLPPITETISGLSEEEKQILGSFSSYSLPSFTQVDLQLGGGPYQREDIFNF